MTSKRHSISRSGKFQDLKALLAELESRNEAGGPNAHSPLPFEIKERTHMLCRKFLGGTWKDIPIQDLILTRMNGGTSNMLFLCRLPEHYPPRKGEPDKTLLRVYFNPETESHLVAESVIFTLLSERKLGPKLYGIFNGGRLEEYIVSRPLSTKEIHEKEFSREIASKLYAVHQLDVPIEKEPDYLCDALERWTHHLIEVAKVTPKGIVKIDAGNGRFIEMNEDEILSEIVQIRFITQVWHKRDKTGGLTVRMPPGFNRNQGFNRQHSLCENTPMSVISEDVCSREITMDEIMQNFLLIKRCVARSHSPIVFCHNDLQEGNILLPQTRSHENGGPVHGQDDAVKKPLVFIDFEYASYNYRGFDFANHFLEWTIDYSNAAAPYFSITESDFPSEDTQRFFFESYLACAKLSPHPHYGIDRVDTPELLMEEMKPFIAVSHFFWGVWALLQLEVSPVVFGFEDYGKERLRLYYENKPAMLALLNQAPPPRSPCISRSSSVQYAKSPLGQSAPGTASAAQLNVP